METELNSLISRRSEIYHYVPAQGDLLEIGAPEHEEELRWWTHPRGFRSVTRVGARNASGLETVAARGYQAVVILPGLEGDLERVLTQVMGLLAPFGTVAVAAAGIDPQALLALMQLVGLDARFAAAWTIGVGSYAVAGRIG